MSETIQLISDGDGVLVVGDPATVSEFVAASRLAAVPFNLKRVSDVLDAGVATAQSAAEWKDHAGQWVKLTRDSYKALEKYGVVGKDRSGMRHAVVSFARDVKNWSTTAGIPSQIASNPAALTGASGLMAQAAMEQLVQEITEYLAVIDKKLDAVLRTQVNQVLARLDGVDFAVKEAASVRQTVGRVSDITWSKLQTSSITILETQSFALRQLADVATKIEEAVKVDNLADAVSEAENEVEKWLGVLALCVRLYDSVAVIELDRVMDASPSEVEAHLEGLRAARHQRLVIFGAATSQLLERLQGAVSRANSKVLFNPLRSPAVVSSSNHVAQSVHAFHDVLSIESEHQTAEARRWIDAASEQWVVVREGSVEGLETAKRLTGETRRKAELVKGKIAGRLSERTGRRSDESSSDGDERATDQG